MTSMLYTMGTALGRAAENGYAVALLVEGCWLEGRVAANDGVGVVLESSEGQHSVVRTERISAVQVHAESPYQALITDGAPQRATGPTTNGARPMPGPQPAYA